jgi:hypothetical protein
MRSTTGQIEKETSPLASGQGKTKVGQRSGKTLALGIHLIGVNAMATLTQTAKPVKPVSVEVKWLIDNRHLPNRESLLEINGTWYWFRPHFDHGRTVGYRLEKIGTGDQTAYDLDATQQPWTCECKDYLYRRAGKDAHGCKHIAGIRKALDMPIARHARYAADFIAQRPPYWGDDLDGDPGRPSPEEFQDLLANTPDEPPYTAEDIDRMAGGLIDIRMDDDQLPF